MLKITILSPQYFPILGGVPVVANLLGRGLKELGHEVTIITATEARSGVDSGDGDVLVLREPGLPKALKVISAADLVISVGVSLKSSWPAALLCKPHLVSHQAGGVTSSLKRMFLNSTTNIACSRWLADQLSALNATSVPNPYDDRIFFEDSTVSGEFDFVFVGRVVETKGVFTLLDAMRIVAADAPKATLTIIGDGVAFDEVRAWVGREGLQDNVRLLGRMDHHGIAKECQRHQFGVVPSQWEEPFGIVALELAACGLYVLGAQSGGLPQAVGPCGSIFEKGNAEQLADAMSSCLSLKRDTDESFGRIRRDHVANHTPKSIARQYLDIAFARYPALSGISSGARP